MNTVHAVLPGDVADPTSPSGGNIYDLRVCRDLAAEHGWRVHRIAVPGSWPRPGDAARAALDRALADLPDGAAVLLDGLVGCGVPEVVVPHAHRLRLVVLVHLPLADEIGLPAEVAADLADRERRTLRAARAVVVTSAWTARRLAARGMADAPVHVAPPGSDPAPLAPGTGDGSALLCVAAVTPHKGHDLLVDALARVADLAWQCDCAGPLHRAPDHVAEVRRRIDRYGLGDRVRLLGPLDRPELDAAYAAADLVVLASRGETYGMVLPEALRRGIPVLATAVGAVPDTLGRAPDGGVPGMLVPPEDAGALAGALRRWLTEPELRRRLHASATSVRGILGTWQETSRLIAGVLERLH
ncbi:glycosyltransferase family 4 protein [Gandjariella thermophila]|uniref:Glycosyl transferase n=1 Tax=Gandjariella thermophila TaxID=1931992 RepID=A0A4D4JBZ1_9PSEU|nr:glycosyltransferase family 4 protein [Gandjariella thermophila]GDY32540.1 glycosyl transferase [Gandjariella thermophila]